MRVFVTGGSGFIGSAVVSELSAAGHSVLALARSDASAAALSGAGAEVRSGTLEDLDALRAGARDSDAVIHLAFIHDFSRFADSVKVDRQAIDALGSALVGTDHPLSIAGGVLGLRPGKLLTEHDEPGADSFATGRHDNARATLALATRGVRASVVRLAPTVHGPGDHGFVAELVRVAKERGVSGYVGDGTQRWPAVHRLDAARLFRLAIEKAPGGSTLHGTAEEGVQVKVIAEVIGRKLNLPVASISASDAPQHFGWIGGLVSLDAPTSSARTRELLDWQPRQPTLLDDLEHGHYTK